MRIHFINYLFLAFILASSFYAKGQSQIGLPLVKNYSPEEYEGGIQNWQIVQDERGIIYVANNFGLLQYDGNNWRVYPIEGISRLRSITLSQDGRVYTGSQGDFGYFEGDSIGLLTYHSLKTLVPEAYKNIGEAWKTYQINKKVYFCTFDYIYVYHIDHNTIDVIEPAGSLDISHTANNKLYPYVVGKGLHKLENGKLTSQPFTDSFSKKIVSGVIPYGSNELLITTKRDGIYMTNGESVRPWNRTLNVLFRESFINCATLLSNGNLALGTQHQGIYIINPQGEVLLHLDKDRGLRSRTVLSLFEDQNQNLWVGQNNGISFVQLRSPFRLINENVKLPGTGYTALLNGTDLYLGTNNGVYHGSKDGALNIIPGTEGQVYGLQLLRDNLFIGHNNGALKISKGKVEAVGNSRTGSWLFQEHNGHLLKGTYEGIDIIDNHGISEIGKIDSLNESSRIIVKENDSTVWMSHIYKGIYKIAFHGGSLHESSVTHYNEQNGLPSNNYNTVHLIEGALKISTEDGIYTYNSLLNNFELDSLLTEHFKDDLITALKTDIYGNIYFISTNSIGLLEKQGISGYKKHTAPFNAIRHLLNDDLPNINIIGPNLVLFGAKEGFLVFDRNLFWTTEQEKFQTMIRQVYNTGKKSMVLYDGDSSRNLKVPSSEDEYQQLSYDNNTLAFQFASSSFDPNFRPQFQFRLLGFDKDWQPWTETSFKEYTNLKEGFYSFQVRSRNANEKVSGMVTYSFTIIYPWYRSPLAYIIYVLLGASSIIGLIVSLDRGHQMEKKRLEKKRVEEVSEKQIQLNKIEKKKEDEINQLQKDKLESEIIHMNTELATNTMHILNKNEFISGIKSTLSAVTKKSTNNEVKNQISGIIKDIERNIQTDGDWQNFQIHFEKVHGDFSRRLKQEFTSLSPQDIKLSAYLRLNLSTKEIANLLNISARGVEIGRYRLRKKLNLTRSQNLAEFILNY